MSAEASIYHIATADDIAALKPGNDYRCPSLLIEGFIHCCERHQLAGVVQRYYQDIDDLKLLRINPDKLTYPLIRENTVGGSELFPHIYGPIDHDAIVDMTDFSLDSKERSGLFE
jgi:uncharacterized protein (DUF952 family)